MNRRKKRRTTTSIHDGNIARNHTRQERGKMTRYDVKDEDDTMVTARTSRKTRNNTGATTDRRLVIIGSDHAGFATKQAIIKALATRGQTILDVGTFDEKRRVDYPDYATEVARAVTRDKRDGSIGVLVCGTGTGMCIAANKINGIRAALGYDTYSTQYAREHNDANILCLRGRNFPAKRAVRLTKLFLNTEFSKEPRHIARIKKLTTLERTHK